MKKIILLTALIAISLIPARHAAAMPLDKVPNPQVESASFVEDAAGVLGPEYSSLLDSISRELQSKTGAELAIVTVDNLDGITVEDYAVRLFKRFGIGKKGKDNGMLILFARDDRKVRIEVGYGLEGIINDAKAGRILDEYAIPRFKAGDFGRGLYDTAKAVAEQVAKAQGISLVMAEPAEVPEQQEQTTEESEKAPPPPAIPLTTQLGIYVAVLLLIGPGGSLLLYLRIRGRPSKAGRRNALGNGALMPVLLWFMGVFGMITVIVGTSSILSPMIAFVALVIPLTIIHWKYRSWLSHGIEFYRLPCPECGKPMDMFSETDDNQFLDTAEIAEEKAGGMDYEFWKCSDCGASRHFAVKMGKADECPKCRRRTVSKETKTLVAATASNPGRELITYTCENPGCGYKRTKEQRIPNTSSPMSSSYHGSSSSGGGSSFGGGSSGGGGASRGW